MNRLGSGLASCRAGLFIVLAGTAYGQESPQMPDMPGMNHESMDHSQMAGHALNASGMYLMHESSGTDFQPSSWKMPMLMSNVGDWRLMWMGQAFIVDTQQAGPRGGDKLYSTNWGMLGAIHQLGSGSIMLRSMISLEPATITDRRYPLLFQTGETAYGRPIVDGQHPHDLFMEVSIQYARPLGENGTWSIYYAPVGDPALGPVAYPHRASAAEFPQAPLGHHWEDSTHIADNVVTASLSSGKFRFEASGFYGREPDENRWNFDFGSMDSWSTRLSYFPAKNWAAQISIGRLHRPEALQPGDEVRTTASIEYIRPLRTKNSWATSLIWGQDDKLVEHRRVNAVMAETVVPVSRKNLFTGRFEWSQRDELFDDEPQLASQITHVTHQPTFVVNAVTLGYTRELNLFRNVQTGVGANVSSYVIDQALKPFYGSHPWGINIYLRLRLRMPDKT